MLLKPTEPPLLADDILLQGGRTRVIKRAGTVLRDSGPWTATVHALLRHLEDVGFQGAPRIVGTGFDEYGREVLTYLEGHCRHPHPFSDDELVALTKFLKQLHEATSSFIPPQQAIWREWFGRDLQKGQRVIGHGDVAPWNLILRTTGSFALIDWENAGPVDALVELAQLCWLAIQLCDDDIAERIGLPSASTRAHQVRLVAEAYKLSKSERFSLLDTIIEIAILDAADQAIAAKITPEYKNPEPLWGLAWRARAAAWIIKNKQLFINALS